jgi:hypothetical protein
LAIFRTLRGAVRPVEDHLQQAGPTQDRNASKRVVSPVEGRA